MINSPELSPLQQRLIAESGSAWEVHAEPRYLSEKAALVFLLRIYGSPGVQHEALVRSASEQLAAVSELADADLLGAARLAEVRLAAALEDPAVLASLLAAQQAMHDDWSTPFERLRHLRALGADDVRAAAKLLLSTPAEGAQTARPEATVAASGSEEAP